MTLLSDLSQLVKDAISAFTSKIIVATIILLIGFIIGKIIGKVILRALHEIELNKIVKKVSGINIHLEEILSGFLTYFIYFLAVVMALRHLGLATDILNILSGAVILIIAISIILSIKDIIPNVISGIIIHHKKFITVGDHIEVMDMKGTVKEISLTELIILSKNGDIIRIPNSIITNSLVKKKKLHSL